MAAERLREGSDYWRRVRAGRAGWLIDGAAYFEALDSSLRRARRQVLILAWDIDSRIRLRRGDEDTSPPLDEFIDQLLDEQPELDVYLLSWDYASIYAGEREWFTGLRFKSEAGPRLHFRFDDRHATGASHHQKLVVIDDRVAFCGGLDLTASRWDTRRHEPGDPGRRTPGGDPYGPFHDVQAVVSGDAARALGELARERWQHCTGERLAAPGVDDGPDPWPPQAQVRLRDTDLMIARTRAAHLELSELREVEQSYLTMIAGAESYIYLEGQYFTSATISDALAARLEETDGPEIVMVMPRRASGWLEEKTMGALRKEYLQQLGRADRFGRLGVFYPAQEGLEEQHVKVHSKLAVVDDRLLRIGSANLSARSMGLDSECDLLFPAGDQSARRAFHELVADLAGEHTGVGPDEFARHWRRSGSLVESCRACAGNGRRLETLRPDDSGPDEALPLPRPAFDADEPVDVALIDKRHGMSRTGSARRHWRLWGFAGLLLALAGLALIWRYTPLGDWLEPGRIARLPASLREAGPAPLIVISAFVVGSLLIVPVTLLIVGSAFIYGAVWGSVYSMLGILVSGGLTYGLGALLGRDAARTLAGPKITRISQLLGQQGILTLATLRLIPVAPYTIVNIVAGASHIRLRDFLIGSLIGMLPGVVAIGFLASGTGTLLSENRLQGVLLLGAALGILAAIAIVARVVRRQRALGDE